LTFAGLAANLENQRTFGRSLIFQIKTRFLGDEKMRFFKNCLMVFTVVFFTALVCPALEVVTSPNDTNDTGASAGLAFPYIAQVTGDGVYVRCGPGTNYYPCVKVNATDRVTVVATKFGWSHIVPPSGSFSWVSKQYVAVDQNSPGIGIVTSDSVRVYAGSEYREPIHCDAVQLHLSKGDKVELTGIEEADYYKIAPPTGAYLWVLTDYIQPLGPAEGSGIVVEPQPATEQAAPVPKENPVETEKLKEYYVLQGQIKAELAKPAAEQNYVTVSEALSAIADNNDAGKAARYAQFALKQIQRYELASEVEKAVRLQDAQLEQVRERIDQAQAAKLAQVPDLGKYTAVGQFQISSVYDPQMQHQTYYRIVDSTGNCLCYAVADGPVAQIDLSSFQGKQVGITGTIETRQQTGDVLVKFTEIVELTR
jgi:uncharacterized protein YgiM (DUF1202 family)